MRVALLGLPVANRSAVAVARLGFEALSSDNDVAAVPVAAAGPSFAPAARFFGAGVFASLDHVPSFDSSASSFAAGQQLVRHWQPGGLWPVTGAPMDGGAGLLAALGGVADRPLDQGAGALVGVSHIDLSGIPETIFAAPPTLVVPHSQIGSELTGLRGVSSRLGHAIKADPAELLQADQGLADLRAALGMADQPGLGAGCGLELAIRALGGRCASGFDWIAANSEMTTTFGAADLVVAITDRIDIGNYGGEIITQAAHLAAATLVPFIVIATKVGIGPRELRTLEVEAAHELPLEDETEFAGNLRRLIRSWR